VARIGGRAYIFAAGADGFTPVEVSVTSEQSTDLVVRGRLPSGTEIAVNGAAAIKAIWQGEQP
jgi:hypothetical protein